MARSGHCNELWYCAACDQALPAPEPGRCEKCQRPTVAVVDTPEFWELWRVLQRWSTNADDRLRNLLQPRLLTE